MANASSIKNLLNRNPLLSAKEKSEILGKWEAADSCEKAGLVSILQDSENNLKTALIGGLSKKSSDDFLSDWKQFETKARKDISGKIHQEEAKSAEANLLSELDIK